jgi:acylphosphatase
MSSKAVRVQISGRVQGVFYRLWAQEQARGLGVNGWVRNCLGGDVEGHFEGPEEAVDALVAVCRNGPPSAFVANIAIEDVGPIDCRSFEVRPSA